MVGREGWWLWVVRRGIRLAVMFSVPVAARGDHERAPASLHPSVARRVTLATPPLTSPLLARSKNLDFAREETSHALAERARLDMEQKGAVIDVKREGEMLNRAAKEYSTRRAAAKPSTVGWLGCRE